MSLRKTTDSSGITTLTITRPESLNALNLEILEELAEAVTEIRVDSSVRGAILTGDGEKAFVAGADIAELSILDQQGAYELSKKGQRLFHEIEHCPKPFIAAVNGFALGGGCELAMACHMRFATLNAKFGQPEINLGIIPGYGGTQRLTQLIGRGKALELLLSADMISAEEAKSLGLVNQVFSSREEMMTAAFALMKKITTKSPGTIAHIIRVVNSGFDFEKAGYEEEAQAFAACAETEDFREGTKAFLEKRKPSFKGK
jgi:enoyl-CoA hydratase